MEKNKNKNKKKTLTISGSFNKKFKTDSYGKTPQKSYIVERKKNVKAPFNLMNNEDLHLRVFIDKNIIEIFANDKQAIVYEHEYIRNQPNIKIFSKDDDLFVESIQTWKMKNIYSNK